MSNLDWHSVCADDTRSLRNVFGTFMTGVTIVTTREADGTPRGFTANSFTSVSLSPALVLVCIAKSAGSVAVFSAAERFAINILGDWQRELSNRFAGRSADKFDGVELLSSEADVPCLADSLSVLSCRRHSLVEAGDHVILIGEVQRYRSSVGSPLGYFRGSYIDFAEGAKAIQVERGSALKVGCLIARDNGVLLIREPGQEHWSIPEVFWHAGVSQKAVIDEVFRRVGLVGEVSFIYSMFEEAGDDFTRLIFRADASGELAPTASAGRDVRVFRAEDEPWLLVRGDYCISMLHRFFSERQADSFGIYCDTADGGRIAGIAGKPVHWLDWKH
ncbi:flavin reductase [Pseudomonas nicosulfuronedens]|uniref:Flavin reductase n=1 Tax=Pseudomonas nicosulfuronedens TaxID=2571105 RepID=A0A5R9R7I3_9PSED|nr:flavin reductase [Pseudomonas nicosulfuronedens]MDH1010116.1 flavin reductase [Pseudomonas nicosulfuronedens]MDH1980132.1 flavin reductase [Pseudomonas nicosulfuronedens]MDH2025351.1 flavin reductase [Pseudomonas nicosulfuronedens]TLX78760.1 flavin reductase [Pseudomonas nicosulfuronedens]